jgi:hypothetical protein
MKKTTVKIAILFISLMALVAWSPNHGEAPYTGSFSLSYPASGQVKSSATSIKWTTAAINDMDGDGNSEYLDQTADCVGSGGDKLDVSYVVTNIPDHGVAAYNDCGNSSIREEVELHIDEDSLVAGASYYYNVVWLCKVAPTSGEINVSFEPAPWDHDWLDKVNYSCSSTASIQSQQALMRSALDVGLQEEESKPAVSTKNGRSDIIHQFENGIFAYEVVRNEHGKLRVRVNVEFEDPQILEAYENYNRDLAIELASKEQPVLTVITFASPLTVGELRELTESLGMEVVSYSIFGSSQEDDITTIHVWPQSKTVEEIPVIDGVTMDGVMTVTGIVDSSSLPVLSASEEVALIDVIGNQIQSQVQSDLGEFIELGQLGIPTPAWSLIAGEI